MRRIIPDKIPCHKAGRPLIVLLIKMCTNVIFYKKIMVHMHNKVCWWHNVTKRNTCERHGLIRNTKLVPSYQCLFPQVTALHQQITLYQQAKDLISEP